MSFNRDNSKFENLGFVEFHSRAVMQPAALTADLTVTPDMPSVLILDAVTTAGRKLILPLPATIEGKIWFIRNIAAATGTILVRDAADANTLSTIAVNGALIGGYMNGVWRTFANAAPGA